MQTLANYTVRFSVLQSRRHPTAGRPVGRASKRATSRPDRPTDPTTHRFTDSMTDRPTDPPTHRPTGALCFFLSDVGAPTCRTVPQNPCRCRRTDSVGGPTMSADRRCRRTDSVGGPTDRCARAHPMMAVVMLSKAVSSQRKVLVHLVSCLQYFFENICLLKQKSCSKSVVQMF